MRRVNTLSLLIAGLLIGSVACAAEDSPLALTPASSKILPQQTIDFQALIGAAAHDITDHVQMWSSSNPAVASISSTGQLTALTPGATTITAGIGALRASAQVTVLNLCLMASSFANGVVPNTLDENQGSDAAGINLGSNDLGYNRSCGGAPRPNSRDWSRGLEVQWRPELYMVCERLHGALPRVEQQRWQHAQRQPRQR